MMIAAPDGGHKERYGNGFALLKGRRRDKRTRFWIASGQAIS
jgi:hypothetical protein